LLSNLTKFFMSLMLSLTATAGFGGNFAYPLYSGAADTICAGHQFYDATGTVVTGTKDCSSQDPNLKPENIRVGVTAGRVTGTLAAETHTDCSADGATGCVNTSDYLAADAANLTATKIKSGITLGGVAVVLPLKLTVIALSTAAQAACPRPLFSVRI
jgi:hypothetical protein